MQYAFNRLELTETQPQKIKPHQEIPRNSLMEKKKNRGFFVDLNTNTRKKERKKEKEKEKTNVLGVANKWRWKHKLPTRHWQ